MSEQINEQFNSLYDDYANVIMRLCTYKTNNREVALDLTQEIFLKMFSHLQKKGMPDKPKAFLYQIARNAIIDYYRKHTTDSLDSISESGTDFEESTYGHDATITNSEYRIAIETIEKLEANYKEVLYLRLVEDMPVKEIAVILDISESNVSVRISRGREQLQKMLS